MQSIRQVARNTFRLSRRFSADAAAPQTPPEKAKQFVLDNQKQIGGGVFTLILFKMIGGKERKGHTITHHYNTL